MRREKTEEGEFVDWYGLKKEQRDELVARAKELQDLCHSGKWWIKGIQIYMDGIYPSTRFRVTWLSYDQHMPKIRALMDKGIMVQIAPVNFNTLEIVFVFPKPPEKIDVTDTDRTNPVDVDRMCF